MDNFPGERRTEENVSVLLEPSFRAIQGRSGCTLVDPKLHDNVLLPDDFAEYIYYIRNAHDMHSIIQGRLIPGGRSLKRDRQSVFFTAVNPMHANQDLGEVQYDLGKPRLAVYKNTWRIHQNRVCWCNVKLAVVNTQPAICIEQVVYMKTGEYSYCKVHQSSRLPRVVLTPNLQYGRQDPPDPEARKSTDNQNEQSVQYRETCRSLVEDTRRKHLEESQRGKCRETCRGNDEYRNFTVYFTQ